MGDPKLEEIFVPSFCFQRKWLKPSLGLLMGTDLCQKDDTLVQHLRIGQIYLLGKSGGP